jgi:hypothetical protein
MNPSPSQEVSEERGGAGLEESVIEMTVALARGKLKQAAYAEWLSKNSKAG